jgi:hypothetical protein
MIIFSDWRNLDHDFFSRTDLGRFKAGGVDRGGRLPP